MEEKGKKIELTNNNTFNNMSFHGKPVVVSQKYEINAKCPICFTTELKINHQSFFYHCRKFLLLLINYLQHFNEIFQ